MKENEKKSEKEENVKIEKNTEKEEKLEKKEKVESEEKALFFQRVVAYLIDAIIISLIVSIISFPFVDSKSAEKINNSTQEIVNKYIEGKINLETYATEAVSLSYQSARVNGAVSLITIIIEVCYFIIYQLYNKGQTIGKKLMKIRVVSENETLSMNQMIFRSLIINSILVEMISFGFMLSSSKYIYFYGAGLFEAIGYVIIFITILMVMFSKSGKGIHDYLAHTRVIKD